jgi:hypothetical protein
MEAQEKSFVIRSTIQHAILLENDQETGGFLGDEVDDVLVVLVRDRGPVQTFSLVFLLLVHEDMFVKLLLQSLIGKVDAAVG